VLITPGNPSGVMIPPAGIAAFAALARRRDLAF
jgi:aspartate/methionine/tyrosine aminotransferase